MKKTRKNQQIFLAVKVLRIFISIKLLRYLHKGIISKKNRDKILDRILVKLKIKEETRKMKIYRIVRHKKQKIKKRIHKKITKVIFSGIVSKVKKF